jgi:hypothetical protein
MARDDKTKRPSFEDQASNSEPHHRSRRTEAHRSSPMQETPDGAARARRRGRLERSAASVGLRTLQASDPHGPPEQLRGALGRKWASCPAHAQAACPVVEPVAVASSRARGARELARHVLLQGTSRRGRALRAPAAKQSSPCRSTQARGSTGGGRACTTNKEPNDVEESEKGRREIAGPSVLGPQSRLGRARWSCARASRSACSRGWRPSARTDR